MLLYGYICIRIIFGIIQPLSLTISVVIHHNYKRKCNYGEIDDTHDTIYHITLAALTSSALHYQQNGPILRPPNHSTLTSSPTARFHNPPYLFTRPTALDNKMYNLHLRHSRIPNHSSTQSHRIFPPLGLPRSLLLRIAGGEIPRRIGESADCALQ